MTQEEIIEYNRRCAEFLNPEGKLIGSYYLPKFGQYLSRYGEVYFEECFRKDEMKFHSDWNWIMEVKTSICNSIKVDEFNTYYDSVAKGYNCSILPAYKNTFDGFYTKVFNIEKEAVVQAINQFLIWYNENNKK